LLKKTKLESFIEAVFPCLEHRAKLGGHTIKVGRAPEPQEVLWENIGEDPKRKSKLGVISFFLSFLIIAACFGIVFLIQYGQVAAVSAYGENSKPANLVNFASSIVIVILNAVMSEVLRRISRLNKHSTFEGYLSTATIRLSMVKRPGEF
jgi:hypothetical protein